MPHLREHYPLFDMLRPHHSHRNWCWTLHHHWFWDSPIKQFHGWQIISLSSTHRGPRNLGQTRKGFQSLYIYIIYNYINIYNSMLSCIPYLPSGGNHRLSTDWDSGIRRCCAPVGWRPRMRLCYMNCLLWVEASNASTSKHRKHRIHCGVQIWESESTMFRYIYIWLINHQWSLHPLLLIAIESDHRRIIASFNW